MKYSKIILIILVLAMVQTLSGCVEDHSADFNEAETTLFQFKDAVEKSRTNEAKKYLALDWTSTDPNQVVRYLTPYIAHMEMTRFNDMMQGDVMRLYYDYENPDGKTGSFWVSFAKDGGSWKIIYLQEVVRK